MLPVPGDAGKHICVYVCTYVCMDVWMLEDGVIYIYQSVRPSLLCKLLSGDAGKHICVHVWMDGWMDGCVYVWMDGCMYMHICVCVCVVCACVEQAS